MIDALEGWSEFSVAVAGAAAALAGLIIVAMSVNIERILATRSVPARAAAAIGALVLAVAAACLMLVPARPVWLLGIEMLIGAAVVWVLWAVMLRAVLADRAGNRPVAARVVPAALAPVLFTATGGLLVAGAASGLYWLAAASVISIVAGVVVSWVALVELLR